MSKTERKRSSASLLNNRRKSSGRRSLTSGLKHESTILEEPSQEEQSSTLPVEKPKINYQDEVVFIFFDSMLESIIAEWKPIPDETLCECKDATKERTTLDIASECSMVVVEESNASASQSSKKNQSKRSSALDSIVDSQMSPSTTSTKRRSSEASKKSDRVSKKPSLKIPSQHRVSNENSTGLSSIESSHSLDWILTCADENVRITFKNGNRYEGPVSKKVMHGYGKFMWADGAIYEGDFVHGSATGSGSLKYCDLSTYKGEFCKNRLHGKGVFKVCATEMIYSGEWKSGRKHGEGWLSYETGNSYSGEWIDDLREGYGIRQYKSGEKYSGQWFKGNRHGNGTIAWTNSDLYTGSWYEGDMEGYGEYTWKTFLNKTFTFPIKTSYQGGWINSMRNGVGIMNFGTDGGAQLAGVWDSNDKHGAGVIICDDGTVIEKNPLFWHDKPIHVPVDYEDNFKSKQTMPSAVNVKSLSTESVDRHYYIKSNFVLISKQVSLKLLERNIYDSVLSNFSPVYPTFSDEYLSNSSAESNPLWIPIHAPPEEQSYSYYIDLCIQTYFYNLYDATYGKLEASSQRIKSDKWGSCNKYFKWNIQNEEVINAPRKSDKSDTSDTPLSGNSVEVELQLLSLQTLQIGIEEKYIKNTVLLYLPKLYNLYYKYSTIAASEVITFKTVLVRLFLWQMLRDLQIQEITNYNIIELDDILLDNSGCGLETAHDPFEKIYFWQFLHIVLTLAWMTHNPINITNDCKTAGILATILRLFMVEIVEEHVEITFGCSLFAYRDLVSIKRVYNLFLKLGDPLTARNFLCNACVKKGCTPPCYKREFGDDEVIKVRSGRNVVAVGGYVVYLPDEPPDIGIPEPDPSPELPQNDPFRRKLLALRFVGPKRIVKCLTTVCPQILKDDVIINMDYVLSFIDFYDVLLMCTHLAVDNARKRDAMVKWREEKKHQEELELLERLEQERLEKLGCSMSKTTLTSIRSTKKEKRRSK